MLFGLPRNVFHKRAALDIAAGARPSEREESLPARRTSMRKTKEVLRLRYELKLDQRQIARSCSLAVSTVHEYLKRGAAARVLAALWYRRRESVFSATPSGC